MIEGYDQLWKAIIRPPRANYQQQQLGPKIFKYHGLKIQRTDVQLVNPRGFKIKCSHYQPYIRPCKQLPCVIYLHGNSSCRLQGRSCIPYILCHDITLFTFDFSGCGNSQGQYISLGYYQKDDVQTVFQYLRGLGTVSSIGLWGRSMGAVTSLMYADKNPQIACIVCDSPFSNLQKLCKQLAQRFAGGLISFFSGVALSLLARTIKQKNNFDIASLDPLGKHVKKAYIPAFFIAAKDDNFILPKHTQKLYDAYSGQKKKQIVQGDHNSQRSEQVHQAISSFFYNNLHVHQLIKKDQAYIKQQKLQKQKKSSDKQKSEPISKPKHKAQKNYQLPYDNIFMEQQDQAMILQRILKLSLQQAEKQQQKKEGKKENAQQNIQQKKQQIIKKQQKQQLKIYMDHNIKLNYKKEQQKITVSNNSNEQQNKKIKKYKPQFKNDPVKKKQKDQCNFGQDQLDQVNPMTKSTK